MRLGYGEGGRLLGCSGIHAATHPTDKCGSNGLPLTPNAIRIFGRAQRLMGPAWTHENLAAYIHAKRGSSERVFLVTEFYEQSVAGLLTLSKPVSIDVLTSVVMDSLKGLSFLHARGIVARNLCPEHLLRTATGAVKLSAWGLFEMCECGHSVNFPIGVPGYMSPELIASGPSPKQSSPKEDTWALGVIALEMYLGHPLWPDLVLANGTRDVVALLNRTAGILSTTRAATALSAIGASTSAPFRSDQAEEPGESTCLLYLKYFARASPNIQSLESMPRDLQLFLYACLSPLPSARPTSSELLEFALVAAREASDSAASASAQLQTGSRFPGLRCASLGSPLEGIDLSAEGLRQASASKATEPSGALLSEWSLGDVFHLWTLAGGDVEVEMTRRGLLKTQPPILHLPRLVRLGAPELKGDTSHLRILDDHTYPLDVSAMLQRMQQMSLDAIPLLMPWDTLESLSVSVNTYSGAHAHPPTLPLVIRERDFDYQHTRLSLFTRLLRGAPFTRDMILHEARVDVPPFLRAQIWKTVLCGRGMASKGTDTQSAGFDINDLGPLDHPPTSTAPTKSTSAESTLAEGDVSLGVEFRPEYIRAMYETLDLDAPHPSDRQLEVDIPRCHQYDPLLSSPAGHAKLKRVLKAWILCNPNLTYWQGLDSLSAPFIKLHFNDEASAFACLHNFVLRYLSNFFRKDNSQVMQEYLAVFWHLLAYIDPELSFHLNSIGFVPDLFAIPWCLTCFAHVFPLEKIFHMWDTLILHSSSMTVCIAVAILMQSRDTLLGYDFNECILHFSDSPDVDMSKILVEAVRIYKETPPSVYARQFSLGLVDTPLKSGHGDELYRIPPIAVLRAQPTGTLSLHDFMAMYLTGPNGTPGTSKSSRMLVIDVRTQEEFQTTQLQSCSINVPAEMGENEEALLEHLRGMKRYRGRHIVVVGKVGKSTTDMASALIKANFPRVSVLSEGISGLRMQGLLVKGAGAASDLGDAVPFLSPTTPDTSTSGLGGMATPPRHKISSQSSFAKFMGLGKEQ